MLPIKDFAKKVNKVKSFQKITDILPIKDFAKKINKT